MASPPSASREEISFTLGAKVHNLRSSSSRWSSRMARLSASAAASSANR